MEADEEKEDQVMSEIHLGCPPDAKSHFTRFTISPSVLPSPNSSTGDFEPYTNCNFFCNIEASTCQQYKVDEEGDLVLVRRKSNQHNGYGTETSRRHLDTSLDISMCICREQGVPCPYPYRTRTRPGMYATSGSAEWVFLLLQHLITPQAVCRTPFYELSCVSWLAVLLRYLGCVLPLCMVLVGCLFISTAEAALFHSWAAVCRREHL